MAGSPLVRRVALVALIAAAAVACGHSTSAPQDAGEPPDHDLTRLLAFEAERRAATDFAALPPSDGTLGPDPYRIAALPGGPRYVGVLRGEPALVLLDATGHELARIAAPRSPSGLAVTPSGDILVVGDGERGIARYAVRGDALARTGTIAVDALGLRDVALSPDGGTAYVVEEREGRLLAVATGEPAAPPRELGRCHGPIRVAALATYVAVDCLLDHAIVIHRADGSVTRIQHDGPLWSMALAIGINDGLVIAAGGVEDHPLEREDGGFGYIDSFISIYVLTDALPEPLELAAVDVSELGVVTPKWLALRTPDQGGIVVTTAGYASAQLVTLTWTQPDSPPAVARTDTLPGTADAVVAADGSVLAANPLFDAWVIGTRASPVASAQPPRELRSRLGELLFFTEMMAPWSSAAGKLSRFTCETCHFEGYVDGRTHYTGRADIHATTKPLHGLFANRPYFSRALDKTMARMVDAEFRVANRHNGRDPWFALTRADVPWLDHVAGAPSELSPELLRTSLMAFLMDFAHRANPAAQDHARWTPRERAGAQLFRDRCASCHAARLVADDPQSVVPFERWESLVLSPGGPIVWASADYAQTNVLPYVHAQGTRVPSLRRLYKKWPYFTNGRAKSLADVLERFGVVGARSYHDDAPADATRLATDEALALRAFLDLL